VRRIHKMGKARLLGLGAAVALACGVVTIPDSAVAAPRAGVPVASAAATGTTAPGSSSGLFVPLRPHRLMDTATGLGGSAPAPGHSTTLRVLGTAGVPASGVTAVMITITAIRPGAHGYLTIYPDGTSRPGTSNLNFVTGVSQAAPVYTAVGADGRLAFYNGSTGALRLLADISGYFSAVSGTPAGSFVALTPRRLIDTRATGDPIPAHGSIAVSGPGQEEVLSVAAVYPEKSGYLSAVNPLGSNISGSPTSNLNFAVHRTVANMVIAPVGDGADFDYSSIYNGSAAPVDVVVDLLGYFVWGRSQEAGTFVMGGDLPHARRLDVRSVPARTSLAITGDTGIAPAAAGATVLNIAESQVGADGYSVAWGETNSQPDPPFASSVILTRGQVASGLVTVAGAPGDGRVFNGSTAPVKLYPDLIGYYLAAGGTISGTVTDAASGGGVSGVHVEAFRDVYEPDAGEAHWEGWAATTTATDGSYTLPPLTVAGYAVCFDTATAVGPGGVTGYVHECYHDVPWSPVDTSGSSINPPGQVLQIVPGSALVANQALTR
jgi:hypothetical protein